VRSRVEDVLRSKLILNCRNRMGVRWERLKQCSVDKGRIRGDDGMGVHGTQDHGLCAKDCDANESLMRKMRMC
jgi:hypothetical protein